MRIPVLLVCLVCTTAIADDGWRYQSRATRTHLSNDKIDVPPDPPLASFAVAGTFYLVSVDASAHARCDAWTVDPKAKTLAGPNGTSLALDSDGSHLKLGTRCAEWMNVSEVAGGVDVDGSSWFRDRGACMRAIAKHRPVATDLSSCIDQPAPKPGPQVRAALDRVLTRGGTLFAIVDDAEGPSRPRCEPVRVGHDELHHELTSIDFDDRPIHGTTTWQFSYTAGDDELDVTDGSTSWSDGSGMGLLCAHEQHIELGPDWADLGERYYFSAATCRAAIAREHELASWFAKPATRHAGGPGFGGC